jgi:serine/threonine-protein kinase
MGPIGQGGVSIVYHAVDTVRRQPMAIKMLAPTHAGDTVARERVRREALITNMLRHPSVPKVYDFGDAPLPDGSVVPYVVMELLTGVMLAAKLAAGALPWQEAVRITATVGDVLAVAHRRGIVHRDLSAENIMITTTGVKLIDFGLAVTTKPLTGRLTAAPTRRVTSPRLRRPMSQAHSSPAQPAPAHTVFGAGDPADDVYALGVLLYQMLTGSSPHPGGPPRGPGGRQGPGFAAGRLHYAAPTPVLSVPGMPREIADITRACMAKRPAERPESSAVALSLWSILLAPRPRHARPEGP